MKQESGSTRTRGWWLAGIALAIGALLPLQAVANPALQGALGESYQRAYDLLGQGEVVAAATELIEYLRAVPGDDLAAADAMVGPSQLLGFSIASLMTTTEQAQLLMRGLQTRDYPTDALLLRTMEYLSGNAAWSYNARGELARLASSDHLAVATAAAGILTYGERKQDNFMAHPAIQNLIQNYPQLEATRAIVEAPVFRAFNRAEARREAEKGGAGARSLLAHADRIDGRQAAVFTVSPGLERAAEALPSMRADQVDDGVLAAWAVTLDNEPDPRARYTLVALLARGCETADERARVRPHIEALAARPPATADVVRARAVLAELALADHDALGAFHATQSLVSLGILPATAERSLYEVQMNTSQRASEYFTRYGHISLAIQTHEALAAKYPGSVLAKDEARKAEALREDGVQVSIALVREEANLLMRNAEVHRLMSPRGRALRTEAIATLEDVIAHTPNDALRANLIDRLNRIDEPAPPPPPRRAATTLPGLER